MVDVPFIDLTQIFWHKNISTTDNISIMPLVENQYMLQHTNLATTRRYIHRLKKEYREVLTALPGLIAAFASQPIFNTPISGPSRINSYQSDEPLPKFRQPIVEISGLLEIAP